MTIFEEEGDDDVADEKARKGGRGPNKAELPHHVPTPLKKCKLDLMTLIYM